MTRLNPERLLVAGLTIVSLAVLILIGAMLFQSNRRWKVVIGAGARDSESFVLIQALKAVAEKRHPQLTIEVRETAGTAENLALLEASRIHMATVQADVPAGRWAQPVAVLFPDAFHLLVAEGSKIRTFPDLAGKRIDLPESGGQFRSFLSVAGHFGLRRESFHLAANGVPADAIFRVRTLGNPAIEKIVREGRVRLLPIPQAEAMRIRYPAFLPGVIPQGTYLGEPAAPAQDTPTVMVPRFLVAHSSIHPNPVRWITGSLFEDRHEIARTIPDRFAEVRPLLAAIRRPGNEPGLAAGVHPGASEYYDRDKPAFVQTNADFLALILTVTLLLGSWVWEFKRWLNNRGKNLADDYNKRIIGIIGRARVDSTAAGLEGLHRELLDLLAGAVSDLDEDRLSSETFQSTRVIWQIAADLIRERRINNS